MGDQTTLLLTRGDTSELVTRSWRVVVAKGKDKGVEVCRCSGTLVVGTHADVDLRLSDPTVSRYHAELQLFPEGIMVVDLDSSNGTFVGRARIKTTLVQPGGTFRVGKTTLVATPRDEVESADEKGVAEFGGIVTNNLEFKRSLGILSRVARSDATVLIHGETGVGKELVARGVHAGSPRADGPFIVVDCASITPTLLESHLFGHVKGAFTGADHLRTGALETATGGTVFLDEIGELPLELQPRLLRVLEARTVQRVGESKERPIDVRFVAATHRDLAGWVDDGRFRADLYYRLAVVRAAIPNLRDRPEDVSLLAQRFTEMLSEGRVSIGASALAILSCYDWPGNARELRNVIERAVVLATGSEIASEDLLPGGRSVERASEAKFQEAKQRVVAQFERRYVEGLLARHHNNISAAAQEAGLSRNSLYALMKRVGVSGD